MHRLFAVLFVVGLALAASVTTDGQGGVHALWLDHRGMAAPGAGGDEAHHHGHDAAKTRTQVATGAAAAQGSALYYSNGSSEREVVKGVCYCCKTALAAGPDGTLFAAWRHVYPGNVRDIAFATSRDGGKTFSAPARVSEDRWQLDGCPEDGPAMAIDESRTAHVVWPTVVTQPDMRFRRGRPSGRPAGPAEAGPYVNTSEFPD